MTPAPRPAILELPPGLETEDVACPVCPSDGGSGRPQFLARDHLFGKQGRFALVRCPRCRSLRVTPRPRAESLGHFYAEYYTEEGMTLAESLQIGTGNPRFDPVRETSLQRWKQIGQHLDANVGEIDVLDVGCGLGGFLHHVASDPRVRPRGVEMSPRAVEYARRRFGLDVQQGGLEALPLADGTVDVVTLWHVLEHSPDPRSALAEVRRVLRPNGVLAIEIPCADSLLLSVFGRYWFYLQPPTHLNLFSACGLRSLIEDCGFRFSFSKFPFVPMEFLGSAYNVLFRPRGLQGKSFGMLAGLFVGLGILCWELPLIGILRRLRRSGVLRLLAQRAT
jgi:SAM-dependent methyltransferase